MKFTLPSQLNVNRRAAYDFLLEIQSNTIANALQRLLGNDGSQRLQDLYDISVKRALSGRFDGQVSAE
jgi:hypothetical protein